MIKYYLAFIIFVVGTEAVSAPKSCLHLVKSSTDQHSKLDYLEVLRSHGVNPDEFSFQLYVHIFSNGKKRFGLKAFVPEFKDEVAIIKTIPESITERRPFNHTRVAYLQGAGIDLFRGKGVGTMMYLLMARISLEMSSESLGTISRLYRTLFHTEDANNAWERMHSLGWAKRVRLSESEYFVVNNEQIQTASEGIWQIFLKNHMVIEEP